MKKVSAILLFLALVLAMAIPPLVSFTCATVMVVLLPASMVAPGTRAVQPLGTWP